MLTLDGIVNPGGLEYKTNEPYQFFHDYMGEQPNKSRL